MANNVGVKVTAETGKLKKNLSEVNGVLKNLSGNVSKNAGAFNTAQKRIRATNVAIANLNKDANRSDAIFGKLSGTLRTMVGTGLFLALGRQIAGFTKSALDMIETNNLFAVSMGSATKSANEFVVAMSDVVGLDATNMRNAIGTFGLLSRSMGINNDNAETLSTTMYQLGLDLSSLTNVDINQVMADLRSGLLGQSETVYKYGIDVTEASLKTEALAQGISKSVRNMGQGEKMALRYAVMLKQTTLAQGDFANTLETPANQLRILRERFTTLSRTIGTVFLPFLQMTLPYVNAFVKVLNELFTVLARLVGYNGSPIEGIDRGTGGMADNLDDAVGSAKQLKQVMSGIDELNVISEQSSGGAGAGVDLGDPNSFQFNTYDALLGGIRTKADDVADSIRSVFSALAEKLSPLVEPLTRLTQLSQEGFTWLFNEVLVPFASWTWNELLPVAIELIADSLDLLADAITKASPKIEWFYDNVLLPVYGSIGEVILIALDRIIEKIGDTSDTINGFKDSSWIPFGDSISSVSEVITGWFTEMGKVFSDIWTLTIKPLLANFGETFTALLSDDLSPFFTEVFNLFSALGELATTIFGNIDIGFIKPIVDAFTKVLLPNLSNSLGTIMKLLGALGKVAISIATEFIKAFRGIVTFLNGVFTGDFKKAMLGLGLISEAVLNALVALFEGSINAIIQLVIGGVNAMINGMNGAIAGINRLLGDMPDEIMALIGITSAPQISTINQITAPLLRLGRFKFASDALSGSGSSSSQGGGGVSVRAFANGGFPTQGEMFIAREAGAEMVGSINGRTAVANNDQIVQAVAQGVAQAVAGVMQGGGQVIENVINIDGDVLYRNQQKVALKRGRDFGMGVFAR